MEQDADLIAMLHREGYYTRNEEDENKAELILVKQRNGPTGSAHLWFSPACMRFDNPPEVWGGPTETGAGGADPEPEPVKATPDPSGVPKYPGGDMFDGETPDAPETPDDDPGDPPADPDSPFDSDLPPVLG